MAKPVVDETALSRICPRFGIRKLSLFGSVLKGTDGEESDVDLLVELGMQDAHDFDPTLHGRVEDDVPAERKTSQTAKQFIAHPAFEESGASTPSRSPRLATDAPVPAV
jgi:hypothetical protein